MPTFHSSLITLHFSLFTFFTPTHPPQASTALHTHLFTHHPSLITHHSSLFTFHFSLFSRPDPPHKPTLRVGFLRNGVNFEDDGRKANGGKGMAGQGGRISGGKINSRTAVRDSVNLISLTSVRELK